MATCGAGKVDNYDDCVQVVRTVKTVQVPCTRNTYQTYTVKVPRQVTEGVPRTVTHTMFQNRTKQVPYTVNKQERRTRMETQKYQVPVVKYYKKTVMETRERQVAVPYFVQVPETKYRTVTEQVPVQKSTVQVDNALKTVYDTQTRTRCVPVTKMVTRQIPVYSVIAKPAPPCPPETDFRPDVTTEYKDNEETEFKADDNNKDGQISYEEYTAGQTGQGAGNPSETIASQPSYRE